MFSVVVDTNVIVAGTLTSNPRSASREVIDRALDGDFTGPLTGDADFLVTSDRRHLHRLRRIGRTKIVTPGAFIRELDAV